METKQVKLQLKEIGSDGQFIGLASVYGNRDYGGDVMRQGAFTKTLADNGGKFPLFYRHAFNVGYAIAEDSAPEGLITKGFLNLEKQAARDVHSDMKFYHAAGLAFGESIGYRSFPDKMEFKGDTRYLNEVMVFEITLTELPLNDKARVHAVKDFSGIDDIAEAIEEIKAGRVLSAATRARMEQILADHDAIMSQHRATLEKFRALMESDTEKSNEPPKESTEPEDSTRGLVHTIDQALQEIRTWN